MSKEILLTYTKVSENAIKDILDVDPPEQPSQCLGSGPKVFRHQFFALASLTNAALQQIRRLLQQFPLSLPADQTTLPRAEIILRKPDQG
jgi:hypothetical protein